MDEENDQKSTTIDPSHDILEHPRKGVYCKDCKAYSFGENPEKLGEKCPGPVDFSNTK